LGRTPFSSLRMPLPSPQDGPLPLPSLIPSPQSKFPKAVIVTTWLLFSLSSPFPTPFVLRAGPRLLPALSLSLSFFEARRYLPALCQSPAGIPAAHAATLAWLPCTPLVFHQHRPQTIPGAIQLIRSSTCICIGVFPWPHLSVPPATQPSAHAHSGTYTRGTPSRAYQHLPLPLAPHAPLWTLPTTSEGTTTSEDPQRHALGPPSALLNTHAAHICNLNGSGSCMCMHLPIAHSAAGG